MRKILLFEHLQLFSKQRGMYNRSSQDDQHKTTLIFYMSLHVSCMCGSFFLLHSLYITKKRLQTKMKPFMLPCEIKMGRQEGIVNSLLWIQTLWSQDIRAFILETFMTFCRNTYKNGKCYVFMTNTVRCQTGYGIYSQ